MVIRLKVSAIASLFRRSAATIDPSADEAIGIGEAGTAEHTLIAELVAEHRQLEELRGTIERARGSDRMPAALTAFADLLERHIRREERGLFAHFPGALSREVVTALHAEIHTRR